MTDTVNPVRFELSAREQKYAYENMLLPDTVFVMKDEVDPDALCRAARAAVRFHPLFGTRLVKETLYYLDETPLWEQHPEGALIGGGGDGPCLWKIKLRGKEIVLWGAHVLTDWGGMFRFAATLLHLYLENTGVKFDASADCDFPISVEATTADARKDFASLPCAPVGTPKFPAASPLPEALFDRERKGGLHCLTFAESSVRRFATQSETSVFSVIACLLARSIRNSFDMSEGSIIVRVPVDYRRAFMSATEHNFSQGFSLCYRPEKMDRLTDARVETAFRSQLDLYVDRDQMIRTLQKDMERLKRLEDGSDTFTALDKFSEEACHPAAYIIYSHITRTGFSEGLSGRIERIYAVPHSDVPYTMLAFTVSFGGNISTTLYQHAADGRLIGALKRELERREIGYELTEFYDK